MQLSTKRIWNMHPPVASISFRGNLQRIKRIVNLKRVPAAALSLLVIQMMVRNAMFKLRG